MAVQIDHLKFSQFNPQGLMRTTFGFFQDAGINTFPDGPNQQPTDWLALQNVLPATSGGFRRRWGVHTMYSGATEMFGAQRMWAYNVPQDASDPTNTRTLDLMLFTDGQYWECIQVQNSTAATPLTNTLSLGLWTLTGSGGNSPSNFAHAGNVGAVVSRSWFYYCNGIDQAQKVYPGYTTFNTDWNWGIAAPAAYTGTTSTTATSTITAFGGTGNGYTSPTVTISGGLNPSNPDSSNVTATCDAVVVNGAIVSFTMTNQGYGYVTTPTVEITDDTGTGAAAVAVYNSFGVIVAVLPSGPIMLNEGRTYTYAWSNQNVTGHTSDIATGIVVGDTTESYTGNAATVLGPAVGLDGIVPSGVGFTQIFITINPVLPIDIQIDSCILMATSDGGSLEMLYGVAIIPIDASTVTSITYTDTLPDTYSDASGGDTSSVIAIDGVFARFYTGAGDGVCDDLPFDGPLFTQSFNSWMFNPHPTQSGDGTPIIANYVPANGPLGNGNQQQPFQNCALTTQGTFSNNVACAGNGISIGVNGTPYYNFQMVLTGNLVIGGSAGDITFTPYTDAAFMIGIGAGLNNSGVASYVSGPQEFNSFTNSLVENYPLIAGIQDNLDWHDSYVQPFVINFTVADVYPYEIDYATYNHTEREMCILAEGGVIPPGNANIGTYTGLTLLNANLWVDTDSYGNLYGIINNTPPPATLLYPTLHQGRMFGTDGKSLFFSKSLAEVTTSTGLITSKWEEAWPGTNSMPIGLDNELIVGLRSNGQVLHIATAKCIYSLLGTDPSNFSIPDKQFAETGLLSNDLWTTVYAQGQPTGYAWITPDMKMIWSDFNTYQDVSVPVYDGLLNQFQNAFLPYAKLSSFTYGPYNFVVLGYSTTNSANGTQFLLFETVMQKWYQWQTTPSTSGPLVSFVYLHPETGYRGLFFWENATDHNYVRLFDPAYTADDGVAINWTVQTSWTALSDPLSFKTLNEIEVISDEANLHINAYGANTQSDFDDEFNPVSGTYLGSRTAAACPLGPLKTYWAGVPTNARYYSFVFYSVLSGEVESSPIEVLSHFIIEHFPMTRY